MALSTAGHTALVGAPASDAASAYVFSDSGSIWTQQAEFVVDNATPYDHFGDEVALNGPGTTVLIGRYDPGAYFFGMPPAHSTRPPVTKEPPVTPEPPVNAKSLESTTSTTQITTTGATQTSTSPARGGIATAAAGAPVAVLAKVGSETLSPTAFPAAPKGTSALAARSRYGATVIYTLNTTGNVRFTVVEAQRGRDAPAGRCVKPTTTNRGAGSCTRLVRLPGSFAQAGKAGANQFRFTGRLEGRKLAVGNYQLIATPMASDNSGLTATASFRIIK